MGIFSPEKITEYLRMSLNCAPHIFLRVCMTLKLETLFYQSLEDR